MEASKGSRAFSFARATQTCWLPVQLPPIISSSSFWLHVKRQAAFDCCLLSHTTLTRDCMNQPRRQSDLESSQQRLFTTKLTTCHATLAKSTNYQKSAQFLQAEAIWGRETVFICLQHPSTIICRAHNPQTSQCSQDPLAWPSLSHSSFGRFWSFALCGQRLAFLCWKLVGNL